MCVVPEFVISLEIVTERLISLAWYCVASEHISVMKVEGLPVIDVDESEKITVAVRADDLLEGGPGAAPNRHRLT